jgi:VWFA-related protein
MKPFWILATALALAAPAQVPEPGLVLRATTRLVQVNVIVQKGSTPVTGLKKEDFTLTDNGKPQKVAFFAENSTALLPTSPVKLLPGTYTNLLEQKSGTPASITVILIDTLNTKRTDQVYARAQVVKFLQQIQPEDHIGIYSLGRSLRVLHDYTTDSRDLLRRLAYYKFGQQLPNLQGTEPVRGMNGEMLEFDQGLSGRGGSAFERDFYAANKIIGTLRSLEFIAAHLSRVPGRKNLVWVSGGFPLSIGFDSLEAIHDTHRDQRTFGDEVDRTVRALNNANIAIYPVDARGLMTDSTFSAQNRGKASSRRPQMPKASPGARNQEGMQELASRTGGKAYYNTNDIKKAVRDAVADARVTYTLGYYPAEAQGDGKFHTLKVQVHRSGARVRCRKGYFDVPEPTQNETLRRTELNDAVFSPIDATEIGLVVRVVKRQKEAGQFDVLIQVHPRGIGLQQTEGKWSGKLDVLIIQRDAQGRQYNGKHDTIEMRLGQANYDKVSQGGLAYRQAVERNSVATQLRVVVRDASSGAMGSVTIPWSGL